jgi:hypothetical protein
MLVTFPNQKKHLFPPFNLFKFKIQVQKTSLKKKKKGNVSNVLKSKKNKENSSTYSIPISVRNPNPGDVFKEKKRKRTFSNVPKSKKIFLHSTYHFRVQYPRS